VTSAQLAGSRR